MKPILQGIAFILVVAAVAFLIVDWTGLRSLLPQPQASMEQAASQTTTASQATTPATTAQTPQAEPGDNGQRNSGQMTSAATSSGTQAQTGEASGPPAATGIGTISIQIDDRTLTGRAQVGNAVYLRNCVSCHSRDGQAYIPQYPRLSAQIASYTAAQLALFRSGERRNMAMNQTAARLSDQEIADIAVYLAATPAADPWTSRNTALRQQGQTLYTQGHAQTGLTACAGCHGAQGAGNAAAGFPRVAGQSPAYFTTRIAELAALANRTDLPATTLTMAKIARAMTPQETRQLDEYIKTLP